MITCLVWAGVLLLVLLLVLIVGVSMAIAAFPIWPPVIATAVAAYLLTRLPLARRGRLVIAGGLTILSVFALPDAVQRYSLAMQRIGWSGALGSRLDLQSIGPVGWFELVAPFSVLIGLAIGSWIAAVWNPQSSRHLRNAFRALRSSRAGRSGAAVAPGQGSPTKRARMRLLEEHPADEQAPPLRGV